MQGYKPLPLSTAFKITVSFKIFYNVLYPRKSMGQRKR